MAIGGIRPSPEYRIRGLSKKLMILEAEGGGRGNVRGGGNAVNLDDTGGGCLVGRID